MRRRNRRRPVGRATPAAARHRQPRNGRLRLPSPRRYLLRHAQVALASLGRLARNPASSLMTAAVIGIALALPAGLLTLLDNLQRLSAGWDGGASLSLFLRHEVDADAARALAGRLQGWPEVAKVTLLTPEQALAEFRALSGFGDALDALPENPLPAVLIVQPDGRYAGPEAAGALLERLRGLPEVELAQLDLQWVRRFQALMEIGRRGVLVIGALLALAVLLVIGNTIRLDIQNRHEEILVTKLVGGTDAFVRRPFLYGGFWYGLAGGLIAVLLVEAAHLLLAGPVSRLAGLYHSSFSLSGLDPGTAVLLLGLGAGLGLAGSWLAVGRHLSVIEPR